MLRFPYNMLRSLNRAYGEIFSARIFSNSSAATSLNSDVNCNFSNALITFINLCVSFFHMSKFNNKDFVSSKILGKNYGDCVITHAVPNQKVLFSILKDFKIKKPSDNNFTGKHQYLNKFFNIHDCVYFSAGWEYNCTFHHWPFAFIFKKTILKSDSFEFFKTFIISQGWMNVLRYWRDNDPGYLEKIKHSSKNAKREIDSFLMNDACAFWLFEKELERYLDKYPGKKKIFDQLNRFREKNHLSKEYSVKYLNKHYFDDDNIRRIEIVSHFSVKLNSEYFIGLYIKNEYIPKIIPKISRYINKNVIIFDGKKKHKLSDLVR